MMTKRFFATIAILIVLAMWPLPVVAPPPGRPDQAPAAGAKMYIPSFPRLPAPVLASCEEGFRAGCQDLNVDITFEGPNPRRWWTSRWKCSRLLWTRSRLRSAWLR